MVFFLLSLPTPLLQKTFYSRLIKLIAFMCWLDVLLSPPCMGGDHEQFVRRAAAAGKPWAFAEPLLVHTWEPHATQPVEMEGAGSRGFSSLGSLPSLFSSPLAVHSKVDSHVAHLMQGLAHCGPLLPVFIRKVLLEHSHPGTFVLSVSAFAQQ